MDGWVKLYRCSLENPVVCKDGDFFAVWCYLLLNATHQPIDAIFKGERITLQEGQLITGRNSISEKFSINPSKVQRILKKLEIEHQIEQQTGNKNRLISIVKWDLYQQSEQQNEQQLNNNRTTTEQQLNTNKNKRTKEQKNDKNKDNKASFDAVVSAYTQNQQLKTAITDFLQMRKSIKAKMTDRALELLLSKLDKLGHDDTEKIQILEQSTMNSWKGIFELKNRGGNSGGNSKRCDSSNGTPASNVEDEGERLNRIALEKLREQGKQLGDIECDF